MKKLTSIILMLAIVLTTFSTVLIPKAEAVEYYVFNDVPSNEWYRLYVESLANSGIINGTGKGKFEPLRELNKQEYIKLLVSSIEYAENSTGTSSNTVVEVTDIDENDWVYTYLMKGFERGIILQSELDNGKFNPYDVVSRQTAVLWLIRGLGIKCDSTDHGFKDIKTKDVETLQDITAATKNGIIEGYDGKFYPTKTLIRAEAAKIIWVVLDKYDELKKLPTSTSTNKNDTTPKADVINGNFTIPYAYSKAKIIESFQTMLIEYANFLNKKEFINTYLNAEEITSDKIKACAVSASVSGFNGVTITYYDGVDKPITSIEGYDTKNSTRAGSDVASAKYTYKIVYEIEVTTKPTGLFSSETNVNIKNMTIMQFIK